MIGQIGQYATDSTPHCYLHGYVSSRMMRVCSASSSSSPNDAEEEAEPPAGLPLTIAATKLDGLVLALTPFNHSYNYRSALLFGHATLVAADAPEALYAMRLITDSVLPGRWEGSRVPPSPAERQSTRILKVRIASATAKVRTGPPKDDRKDLADPEVVGKVWAGVVPVWERFGEPVGVEYGGGEGVGVPGYVEEWVRAENENAEEYAVGVAGEEREVGREGEGEED